MTSDILRVGIIGASGASGWGREAHLPAIRRVDGLELTAVGTRSQASADETAREFGAAKAYGNAMALTRDPDIDIVSVVVRLPAHRDYILSALENGKHVYSEWPLGVDRAESEELLAAAQAAGVRTAIGLQSRGDPAIARAGELVRQGRIGRVLHARMYSTTIAWGPFVPDAVAYATDPAAGVDMLSIQGAHSVDAAIAVLGGWGDASGLVSITWPEIEVGDTHERRKRETPDHLLVQARTSDGSPVSIEVAHRESEPFPFRFEITGDKGTLAVTGGAMRGAQSGRYAVTLNGDDQSVDAGELYGLPDTAFGVAGIYARLRDDIRNGSSTAPDFVHAVSLARLVEALAASSQEGTRRSATDWPTR